MTGWRLFMTGYFCLSAVNLSWAKNMNRQSAILSRLWQLLEPSPPLPFDCCMSLMMWMRINTHNIVIF
jgi:hypothetical protein